MIDLTAQDILKICRLSFLHLNVTGLSNLRIMKEFGANTSRTKRRELTRQPRWNQ